LENAPDWQKTSAVNGVAYHLTHKDATPQNSHENWLKDKEADGWKWGPVKDAEKKEHPCFTPYDMLPQAQKTKDFLFRTVVHAGIGNLDIGA
jgi:8-oxo-dGTP pyrophosphatase MutT (NUDIX family)